MATQIHFGVLILLASASVSFTFNLDIPSFHRIERSISNENLQGINEIIDEKLSKENVHSALGTIFQNSLLGELHDDLKQVSEVGWSGIVQKILEHQGTSLERIHKIILQSNGNVNDLIASINAELGMDLLIVKDGFVKINVVLIKKLILDLINGLLESKIARPYLVAIFSKTMENQVEVYFQQLEPCLNNVKISVNALKSLLAIAKFSRSRSRKTDDASKFDLMSSVQDTLSEIIQKELAKALLPVQKVINDVLNEIISALAGCYTPSEPEKPVNKFLSHIVNKIVLRGVEIIAIVQKNVNDIFDKILGNSTVPSNDSTNGFLENDIGKYAKEFSQDETTVANPNVSTFGTISTIKSFLKSLNLFIKKLVENIVNYVSNAIINMVSQLIDIILPCSDCKLTDA